MPVPSSYNDITADNHLRDHVGTVWYDRKFFVAASWAQNKRVWIRFGSVHYEAYVVSNCNQIYYLIVMLVFAISNGFFFSNMFGILLYFIVFYFHSGVPLF